MTRLESENQKLRREVKELRGEMTAMKESLGSLRRETLRLSWLSPPPPSALEKKMEDERLFVPPSLTLPSLEKPIFR